VNSVSYREYVNWCDYWECKTVRRDTLVAVGGQGSTESGNIFARGLTPVMSRASADSQKYRERVQRSLSIGRKLQAKRKSRDCPTEDPNLQYGKSNTEQWEKQVEGWEE